MKLSARRRIWAALGCAACLLAAAACGWRIGSGAAEPVASRFANLAGRVWFWGEELAGDLQTSVASRVAALRQRHISGDRPDVLSAPTVENAVLVEPRETPTADRPQARDPQASL